MNFTSRVINKCYTVPLKSELMKKSMEYKALGVLKYCFGGTYHSLKAADKPDLQMPQIGIEVTEAINFKEAQALGEFTKMRVQGAISGTRVINGHIMDKDSITWLPKKIEDEQECITRAFEKKLKKIPSYRKNGFDKVGLFIVYREPLFPDTPLQCFEWLQKSQKESYDSFNFAYLLAAEILGVFDFDAKSCNWLRIKRDDMDSIKKLARMTAEGEISEEDVEWQM